VIRILVILLMVAAAVTMLFFLPVTEWLATFLEWVRSLGLLGAVLVGGLYLPACLLFLPGSPISLAAGFLFGVAIGSVTVSIGSTLGATAAFLAGRTLARDFVARRLAGHRRFSALDQAVAEQGFKIVLLMRLSPLFPFNLLNYAFGLTRVTLPQYVLASWIGMLPGTVAYVYLGSAARSLSEIIAGRVQGGTAQKILFFAGLIATFLAAWLVARLARQAIRKAVGPANEETMAAKPGESR
jgi:uncharacterized membrane protein YdjX (TVP38/TMEM64 family)